VAYVVEDFTAVGSSCKTATPSEINIVVQGPTGGPVAPPISQGESFTPDEPGTWTISASFQGQFVNPPREVNVAGADAGTDFNVTQLTEGQLDGTGTVENTLSGAATYLWTGPLTLTGATTLEPTFDAPARQTGQGANNDYVFTLTVSYENISDSVDTVTVTVKQN
jgi:hypothetical protein